jgi:hypothetical protein
VRRLIENGWQTAESKRPTFAEIFEILKAHDFKVTQDVDSGEVLEYIRSVDAAAAA